jgi:hypothetical protein
MVVSLKANEQVIKAGDSTYYIESDKIEGKLILTNQRIYFKSSNGYSEAYNLEIIPADIKEVIFCKIGRLFSNGLNVVKKDGEEFLFKVKKRNEIGEMINKMY